MINSELGHVTTLLEFNSEIRRQQEEAHGEDYCAIHDAIRKYIPDCKSYMELGVHQGGTASVAMLCKPNRIYLVDIDMSRYNKFLKPIAENLRTTGYCTFLNSKYPFSSVDVPRNPLNSPTETYGISFPLSDTTLPLIFS